MRFNLSNREPIRVVFLSLVHFLTFACIGRCIGLDDDVLAGPKPYDP